METNKISIPERAASRRFIERLFFSVYGCAASLPCWLAAHLVGTPGLFLHGELSKLGLGLLFNRKAPLDLIKIHTMIFAPVVLTRYFEFEFAWQALEKHPMEHYLDVSSPYAFPLLLVNRKPNLRAELINPDSGDLPITAEYVDATGVRDRCRLHGCLLENAPFTPGSFDAITSLSVVEHIPDVRPAVEKMWTMLKTGGKLVLTLPCAREPASLYVNRNEYGLLDADEDGFVFLEYVFDDELLRRDIFSVTGNPVRTVIYGEKHAGFLRKELLQRWSGHPWRYWREPILMGKNFGYFDKISDLPGEGVIGLEIVKA
jgi:SAM-dependent methyltransferase